MKRIEITPIDKTRLLIACVDLPLIRHTDHGTDYIHELMITVLDFHMQTDVVVKASHYFREHVQGIHELDSHERLASKLFEFADTREGNTEASLFLWNNKHWKRVGLLRNLLRYLESVGVCDQTTLVEWALTVDYEKDFQGKVPGLGLAVFQWLMIRCGRASAVKPDVHVENYIRRILGRKLSASVTVTLFNELAPYLGTSISNIDAAIWAYQRMDFANNDASALRIVFWQQLTRRIQDVIENDADLKRCGWRMRMDDPSELRYDESGLHLIGRVRVPGERVPAATHLDLTQSSWQHRFDLSLALWRDKQLGSTFVEFNKSAMIEQGWALGNGPKYEASIGLGMDLVIHPETSIEALMAMVQLAADEFFRIVKGLTSKPSVDKRPVDEASSGSSNATENA